MGLRQLAEIVAVELDIGPTVRDLGYHDVDSAPDAWRRAVRWLVEHPLEPGGPLEQQLQDPFDYGAKDRLRSAWDTAVRSMSAVRWQIEPGYTGAYVGRPPNPATEG